MENTAPGADAARLDDIRSTVEKICASRGFESTGRLKTLLRYLVEEELAGRGERLKAYSIGVDIFGKSENFDPVKDSSVRVAVSNLRQRLDIYYQSETQAPVVISIPSGCYRPHFMVGNELAAMRRSHSQFNSAKVKTPQSRLWLLSAGLLLSFFTLSGFGYWGFEAWKAAQCTDARPTIDVSQITDASETELFSRLQEYLFYYPIMDTILRGERRCSDVPHFELSVSPLYEYVGQVKKVIGYTARLTDEGEEMLRWSKTYHFVTNPYYGQNDLIAAQIAYDIGSGTGAIADLATKRPWDNAEAKLRFQCLVSVHTMFDGSSANADNIRDCTNQYWRTSSHADFKVMFAAFAYEAIRLGEITGQERAAAMGRIEEALEQAEAISPNDKELLVLKIRMARNENPINVAAIEAVSTQMEKYLSHEPHVLGQIGHTNSSYLGNFDKGFEFADRAGLLSGHHSITSWGKVIYYVAMERWDDLIPMKEYVAMDELPQNQIMALCLARKSNDELMESRALRILKRNDLHTVDQYIDHVRRKIAPQQIAGSLENCLKA